MTYVVIAVAWVAVGAAVGVIEARHGSWHRGWLVSAIFGPFSVPLALHRWRAERPLPTVLTTGRVQRGPVDLLIGMDGSEASLSAALLAVRLFGSRVRRVTLAAVLDVDTAEPHADNVLHPKPWPEELLARANLELAAAALKEHLVQSPGSVILAGAPGDALERYAIDENYEVIVVGCRGRGLSKLLLGSCASRLACNTHVPVLLIPAEPAIQVPGRAHTTATPAGR